MRKRIRMGSEGETAGVEKGSFLRLERKEMGRTFLMRNLLRVYQDGSSLLPQHSISLSVCRTR